MVEVRREYLITPHHQRDDVLEAMSSGLWANQLREWRKKCDITQRSAAARMDVSIDTYRGWESMNATPPKFVRTALERLMTVPQEVSRTD